MDFLKRSHISALLILSFVIFTVSSQAENSNWNSEDISTKLQEWIRNVENVPYEVQFR